MYSDTTVTTTPGDCQLQWEKMENMRGQGAVQSAEDTDDELVCRQFCEDLSTCVALDFNNLENPLQRCWLYIDEEPSSLIAKTGIDHHVINRALCPSTIVPTEGKFTSQACSLSR